MLFEEYLVALLKNGQVHRHYLVCRHPLSAYIDVSSPNALEPRFLSSFGKSARRRLRAAFGTYPSCRLVEARPSNRARTWRTVEALYLITDAFDTNSPVRAPKLPQGAPVYSLPIPEDVREELLSWAADYRDHDRIWLTSGALELPAYKELCVVTSKLSKRGRKLCSLIERTTGKPTYYYVKRYYAYTRGEGRRRCPSCGRRWRIERDLSPDATTFWHFNFCCRGCRLVSHAGVSLEGAKYAGIGQFKRRARSLGGPMAGR